MDNISHYSRSRTFFHASHRDYSAVIQQLLSRFKNDGTDECGLTIIFSKATDPARPEGVPPIVGVVDSLSGITPQLWKNSDYIEARLMPEIKTTGPESCDGRSVIVSTNKLLNPRLIKVAYGPCS